MDSKEFSIFRRKLKRTQKQMAQLLGTSLKAIHSYEQGWRNVPAHVERQLFFLLSRERSHPDTRKPCWILKKCPSRQRKSCPAWEFQAGKLCWFVNGNICCGEPRVSWKDKMKVCRNCEVLKALLDTMVYREDASNDPAAAGQKS